MGCVCVSMQKMKLRYWCKHAYGLYKNGVIGRLKCLATGLDASLSFCSKSQRGSWNRSPSRLHVSPL